ncbi:MAG: hypothetical protein IPG50_38035 [Myxococcales bacterium]|nr:hypothetical protein [Myxococcales bacterium]
MHSTRGSLVVLMSLLAAASCVDSDENGTPNADAGLDLDAGSKSDATTPTDASLIDAPTPTSDASDATTLDAGGDSAAPDASTTFTCGAVTQLDSKGGIDGSASVSAATGPSGRWIATWFQTSATSGDGQYHAKARVMDGSTLLPEQDLGITTFALGAPVAVDNAGRAYTFQDASRRTVDLATGTLTAESLASIAGGGTDKIAMAPLRAGGAISLYRTGTAMVADRWDTVQSKWVATDLVGPPLALGMRVVTNAAGKAAALWYVSDGAGGNDLYVSTYDGSHWVAAKKKNFPIGGGSTARFTLALLSTGDAAIAYEVGGAMAFMKYNAIAGTFGAPTTVNATGTSNPALVVDDLDRTTVGYLRGGKAYTRLDTGAGFSPEHDLGAATSLRLKEGPAASVVALTYRTPSIYIARAGAGSSAWSTPVSTAAGISNGEDVARQADVVFDATGRAVVITQQNSLDGGAGLVMAQVTCQ